MLSLSGLPNCERHRSIASIVQYGLIDSEIKLDFVMQNACRGMIKIYYISFAMKKNQIYNYNSIRFESDEGVHVARPTHVNGMTIERAMTATKSN